MAFRYRDQVRVEVDYLQISNMVAAWVDIGIFDAGMSCELEKNSDDGIDTRGGWSG